MELDTCATVHTSDEKERVLSTTSSSWNDYITVVLVESGHVTAAAIHSTRSGSLWAGTPNFRLSYNEIQAIEGGFMNDEQIRIHGIYLNGRHFTLSRLSEQRIMVGRDARSGHGCVVYRCRQCLVVAVYEESNHPGGCFNTVVQLGDFLLENKL
ncbi:profilin [Aplysia californica]|uniref:Profilin n=1 Tax=Aplysia californica TaxID=6500 RepID=A0ABM1VUF9_APLCA|nr:profilin [Aplysia californica]